MTSYHDETDSSSLGFYAVNSVVNCNGMGKLKERRNVSFDDGWSLDDRMNSDNECYEQPNSTARKQGRIIPNKYPLLPPTSSQNGLNGSSSSVSFRLSSASDSVPSVSPPPPPSSSCSSSVGNPKSPSYMTKVKQTAQFWESNGNLPIKVVHEIPTGSSVRTGSPPGDALSTPPPIAPKPTVISPVHHTSETTSNTIPRFNTPPNRPRVGDQIREQLERLHANREQMMLNIAANVDTALSDSGTFDGRQTRGSPATQKGHPLQKQKKNSLPSDLSVADSLAKRSSARSQSETKEIGYVGGSSRHVAGQQETTAFGERRKMSADAGTTSSLTYKNRHATSQESLQSSLKKQSPPPKLPMVSSPGYVRRSNVTRPIAQVQPQTKNPLLAKHHGNVEIDEISLDKMPWYHGFIDRKTAEQRLANMEMDGSFLLRLSGDGPKDRPYVLSLRYQDRCYHLHIRLKANRRYAAGQNDKPDEEEFDSVDALVHFYRDRELFLLSRGTASSVSCATLLTVAAKKE